MRAVFFRKAALGSCFCDTCGVGGCGKTHGRQPGFACAERRIQTIFRLLRSGGILESVFQFFLAGRVLVCYQFYHRGYVERGGMSVGSGAENSHAFYGDNEERADHVYHIDTGNISAERARSRHRSHTRGLSHFVFRFSGDDRCGRQ